MEKPEQNQIKEAFSSLARISFMFWESMGAIFTKRFRLRDLIEQINFIGVKSQSVVLLTGAFTGMVMCAQFYIQFHKVKMDNAVMSVVSVAMCRELGAVLTALMVSGRVGAAMAAQLGTMKVTEQIDALRTLATHPIDFLVAPRLLATLITLPLLTAEAIAIGMAAGKLEESNPVVVDCRNGLSGRLANTALEAAASIAGLLITTEAMIADKPEPKGASGPAMPDMGGMGGMGGMM